MSKALASPGQISRIVAMLASGQITAEEAQAIIRRELVGGTKSPPISSGFENLDSILEVFPSKAAEISEALLPLYTRKIHLYEPIKNLGLRIAQIFSDYAGRKLVRTFPYKQLMEAFEAVHLTFENIMEEGDARNCPSGLITVSDVGTSVWFRSGKVEDFLVTGAVEDWIGDDLNKLVELSRVVTDKDEQIEWPWAPFQDSLLGIVNTLICLIHIEDHEAVARYKALLQIYLDGNLPLGFDKDRNIIVLTAY